MSLQKFKIALFAWLVFALSATTTSAQLIAIEPDFGKPLVISPIESPDLPMPQATEIPEFDLEGKFTVSGNSPFIYILQLCNGTTPGGEMQRSDLQNAFPGAAGFFEYHCALFQNAHDKFNEAKPGQELRLVAELQAGLPFTQLIFETQILQMEYTQALANPDPRLARIAEIMRTRLLADNLARPPSLTLAHTRAMTPDRRPINIPMTPADFAASVKIRQTTFTAQIDGDTENVQFIASGASAIVVSPAGCNANNCIVNVVGGQAAITYEFTEPAAPIIDLLVNANLSVSAAPLHDGAYAPIVTDTAQFNFAMCDRFFVDETSNDTTIADARDGLYDATLKATALPGRRLTEGPIYAGTPYPEWSLPSYPGDIDDLSPAAANRDLIAALNEAVLGKATDAYLAPSDQPTGGLHDARQYIESYRTQPHCNDSESDALLAKINAELALVEAGLLRWQHLQTASENGAYTWNNRVKNGFAYFDATRLSEKTLHDPTLLNNIGHVTVESLGFLLESGAQSIYGNILDSAASNPRQAGAGGALAGLSAGMEIARLIGGILDAESLWDLSSEIDEAVAWTEMDAYFVIMRDRYQGARDDLVLARNRLEEIRRRNCICWKP